MWFFNSFGGGKSSGSSSNDEAGVKRGAVSSFPNTADAQKEVLEHRKGEEHGDDVLSSSWLHRSRSQQTAVQKGDARVGFFDTDAIDCLMNRYGTEMAAADKYMKEKCQKQKNEKGILNLYDYEGDQRYKQWLMDQENVRKALNIHWLDMIIDKPMLCLTYLARIGTTIGFFYGMGRSYYLYHTMDKMYAKLHGVSFFNIAMYEVSFSVVKGAIVAMSGTVGVIAGEAAMNITTSFTTGDISVPERTWKNIWSCGTLCGFFSGTAFSALHRSILTRWGMIASVTAFTTVSSLLSLVVGRWTYQEYANKRGRRLYDPYWRPWYERKLNDGGASYMRGKYT
ncbi:uncharacterized protein TM35_000043030 [Trypanosoma theileri]|uniref:Uncharacterized protein n=1 Tax=Trypanosoma theileri TaxID=67003 RepID=A0A1X0P6A1_9TRYP|nr:uncharacterized protein TM35_000043030 [Trypanosoma theileri]ORC92089.1 hypothetical protein TM35_000043030 [Trypanosoma theileri]